MTATVDFPVEPQVKEFTARRWQLLINGEWVKAKSEQPDALGKRVQGGKQRLSGSNECR